MASYSCTRGRKCSRKRADTNAQNEEPTEVPASKNGQAAPRSVQMPDAGKKEGLKPPQHCQMGVSVQGQRTQRMPKSA
eukprot:6212780-Pleurochrysis_carterae.AAC.4